MTDDEVWSVIATQTGGQGGSLGRACFDGRHADCGWLLTSQRLCQCMCHPFDPFSGDPEEDSNR